MATFVINDAVIMTIEHQTDPIDITSMEREGHVEFAIGRWTVVRFQTLDGVEHEVPLDTVNRAIEFAMDYIDVNNPANVWTAINDLHDYESAPAPVRAAWRLLGRRPPPMKLLGWDG